MEWKELSVMLYTVEPWVALGLQAPALTSLPAFPTSSRYGECNHAVAVPFALVAGPET